MLRIALNGKIKDTEKYIDLVLDQPGCILSGIYNNDLPSPVIEKTADHPAAIVSDSERLIEISDAIIFLGNTYSSIGAIQTALKNSKHVFIFPDSTISTEMLSKFRKLAEEAGVLFYIRHDILSGKFRELSGLKQEIPEFIDIYRYSNLSAEDYYIRLFELLQQEIMYLFSLNPVPLKRFVSNSVPYCSGNPRFINLRFDFINRSTANLSINLFTGNQSRFTELYHSRNMIRFNTSGDTVEMVENSDTVRKIEYNTFSLDDEQNIGSEINNFLHYIQNGYWSYNSFDTGYQVFDTIWKVYRSVSPMKEQKNKEF